MVPLMFSQGIVEKLCLIVMFLEFFASNTLLNAVNLLGIPDNCSVKWRGSSELGSCNSLGITTLRGRYRVAYILPIWPIIYGALGDALPESTIAIVIHHGADRSIDRDLSIDYDH